MLAHHAMPSFQCRATCNHKECQRHANLGIIDQNSQCHCLGEINASSIFLENVLDLANTLAQIMIICGIHECKAKSTVDVTVYSFLHYDQVCYCLDTTPKKRIRKEDLFHELGKKCLMNRVEAHLAYTIIKRGFKAYYYKPKEPAASDPDSRPSYSDECVYVHAAKKTAESHARFDGLSCDEQRGNEAKIRVAYKKFYDRMQTRKNQPAGEDCNCCFCAKKRGHMIYGKEPPCAKKSPTHTCPHCCQRRKRKIIHPSRAMMKCPKCHRSRKFCTCEKYHFALDWVKSIWYRPDFDRYYKQNIGAEQHPANHCFVAPGDIGSELKLVDIPVEPSRISNGSQQPRGLQATRGSQEGRTSQPRGSQLGRGSQQLTRSSQQIAAGSQEAQVAERAASQQSSLKAAGSQNEPAPAKSGSQDNIA